MAVRCLDSADPCRTHCSYRAFLSKGSRSSGGIIKKGEMLAKTTCGQCAMQLEEEAATRRAQV
eukprot:COSAG02_NODE_559_length_20335_cov_10.631894_6_plen_63_part_00